MLTVDSDCISARITLTKELKEAGFFGSGRMAICNMFSSLYRLFGD
jgi:hypothetical protein